MNKVKQEVSECIPKCEHAQADCCISNSLQTLANRGYNPVVAIQMALSRELFADRLE
jgi:transposase